MENANDTHENKEWEKKNSEQFDLVEIEHTAESEWEERDFTLNPSKWNEFVM